MKWENVGGRWKKPFVSGWTLQALDESKDGSKTLKIVMVAWD